MNFSHVCVCARVCCVRWVYINLWLTVSISCGFHGDESDRKKRKQGKTDEHATAVFSSSSSCCCVYVYCWCRCRCCCLLLLQKCNVLKCCKQQQLSMYNYRHHNTTDCWPDVSIITWPFAFRCARIIAIIIISCVSILYFPFSILHLQLKEQQKKCTYIHTRALLHIHTFNTRRKNGNE